MTLYETSLRHLPCVGLLALSASLGCSVTAPPRAPSPEARAAAQSPEAQAAARPAPSAGPPPAAGSAEPNELRSGFHLSEFAGLGRGDRIADLGSGRGYSITPFAAAVGPFGAVYVRHDPRTPSTLANDEDQDVSESAVPRNVIRMDTPLEAPFSPEAQNLDCATLLFTYHEFVAERRDRRSFNLEVFRALKPGGCYIIAEHAPRSGAGPDANRVDAGLVRDEVEAAGFHFVEAADFHAAGARSAERTAETSQYVLKFQKPRPR